MDKDNLGLISKEEAFEILSKNTEVQASFNLDKKLIFTNLDYFKS